MIPLASFTFSGQRRIQPDAVNGACSALAKILAFHAVVVLCLPGQCQTAPENIAGKIYHFGDFPPSAAIMGGSAAYGCVMAYGTNDTVSGILCIRDQSCQVTSLLPAFGTYHYSRTDPNTGTVLHTFSTPSIPIQYQIVFHFETPVSGTHEATFPGFPSAPCSEPFKEIILVWVARQDTNTVRIDWSGGSPPYVVDRTARLSNSSNIWQVVETNRNQSTVVPATDPKAFFRVRSLALESSD